MGSYVLKFRRWGMRGAIPWFQNGNGLIVPATQFAKPFPNREHHADWEATIDHPDAHLIASAPDLLKALEDLVEKCGDTIGGQSYYVREFNAARAAIRQAKGKA